MTESTITLNLEEYLETARKAWKFELLQKEATSRTYLTDLEKAVFELPEKEATDDVEG